MLKKLGIETLRIKKSDKTESDKMYKDIRNSLLLLSIVKSTEDLRNEYNKISD